MNVLTPTCPACGAPPLLGITLGGGTQAFCSGGDGCPVLQWNPMKSVGENLATATTIHLFDDPREAAE